jgi:hypothetical protein
MSSRPICEKSSFPTLKLGDIVAKDNLGARKNYRIIALIDQPGPKIRFLPVYYPRSNP